MKKRGKEKQKSLRQDHQVGEKSSEAIHVPFDLTVEILSRLPVKTLARFRCVSKLWSSSIFAETIKTRSLTQPRQLVIFYQPLLQSSKMSSYTYPLSTNTRFVAADRGTCTPLPCRNNLIYGYVRGLICYFSNSKKFAIYNPTTRQHVLLPPTIVAKHKAFDGFSWYDPVEKHYIVDIKYYHGFFGYDPVKDQYKVLRFIEGPRICDYSCMVITFRGGTSKHEWRNIKIQDDISPPRSNGVCINGIIYYIGGTFPTTSGLVLGRFDVRFERFDHIKIPIDVEMNQLEELSLVNYQGKLGCTLYNKDRAEVWIMKDHHSSEKHEWSKVTIAMSPPYLLKTRIAGVTLNGEIVIMPKTLDSAQMLYAYFYDPRKSKTRRVEFETNLKGEQGVCIFSEPDHMENAMSLLGSQFNKKKKKPATTAVFSFNKILLCPKKLFVITFLCLAVLLSL
ncbi:hypothetical protein Bca4012_035882 [Brassica carinata]